MPWGIQGYFSKIPYRFHSMEQSHLNQNRQKDWDVKGLIAHCSFNGEISSISGFFMEHVNTLIVKEITTYTVVTLDCSTLDCRLLRISTFTMFKLLLVTLLAIICIFRTTYSYEACVAVKPIDVDDDWVSKKS